MTTSEDLAKAREIATQAGIYCRYDCKRVVKTSGMDHIADCPLSSISLDAAIESIAVALAEARTTPKPAAEVVEALEACITELETREFQLRGLPHIHEKCVGVINKARAALAAQSTKEKP